MNNHDVASSLADAKEVRIETSSGHRTHSTIIWVVEVEGDLYVRSFLGDRGQWYQRALTNPVVALASGNTRSDFTVERVVDDDTINAVSEAFVAKYRPGRSRDAMVAPDALDTTLRLHPA